MNTLCRAIVTATTLFALSGSLTANDKVVQFDASKFDLSNLYQDDFNQKTSNWIIESSNLTETSWKGGELDIDTSSGTTVWFKEPIGVMTLIEFDGRTVVEGGQNDRGTDLNFFWMATDLTNPDFFQQSGWRNGKMRNYDSLSLYYVGYGANDNSTTRFRQYTGDGTRPLQSKYDINDRQFMNIDNIPTNIKIYNLPEKTVILSNDQFLYEIPRDSQYQEGWFGFRTWKSHIAIDKFSVSKLVENK